MSGPYCTVQEVAEFLTQLGFRNPAIRISNIILNGVDPVQIYAVSHGFEDATVVTFESVEGTTELNGQSYQITRIDANNFTLDSTDSSLFSAYTPGFGYVYDAVLGSVEGTWPDDDLVQRHIYLSAGEIDVALMSSNQLTCTKDAATGGKFLNLLNIIGTMLITEFDNARHLTDADLLRYQTWKDKNLELLRLGQLAVCAGETGLDYPAVATAEVAYTPESAAKIMYNSFLRRLPNV